MRGRGNRNIPGSSWLIHGRACTPLRPQIKIMVIFVWVFVTSLIVWGILKAVMGIRVSEEEEYEGVDLSECGMEAYPEFVSAK